jgi:hypothetical protein
MGGLYKKEVVVRPTSTMSVQGAKDWTKNWLSSFQDATTNKDANGVYIDYFFADIFFAGTGNIYRVFSEPCKTKYEMSVVDFEILDVSKFATKTALTATNTSVSSNTVAIANIAPTDLTAINTTLGEHTDRIVALETTEATVEAVVI